MEQNNITQEQYNEMIQTESNIIKFIDNNTDLLLLEQTDGITTTRLFGSGDYKEYFNEEKVSELLFGHEAGFIKALLKELEHKTMDDIVKSYQFNIGYNQGIADTFNQVSKQMAELTQSQEEEINS